MSGGLYGDSKKLITKINSGEIHKIGNGAYGQIFKTNLNIDGNNTEVIIKYENSNVTQGDLNSHKAIYDDYCTLQIGPRVYDVFHDNYRGGLIMEKFRSDVGKLLCEYTLSDDIINVLELNLNKLIDTMFNSAKLICSDIKFQNMLVNFTETDGNVTSINKVVLTDFDTNFCQIKEGKNKLFLEFLKHMFILSLILYQIYYNNLRSKKFLAKHMYKQSEFKILFLFKDKLNDISTFLSKNMDFTKKSLTEMNKQLHTPLFYMFWIIFEYELYYDDIYDLSLVSYMLSKSFKEPYNGNSLYTIIKTITDKLIEHNLS